MTDDLKYKSTDELKVLLKKYKEEEVIEDLNQYIRKILINSVYGALGNKHFQLYNPDIADAITSFGRYSIQTASKSVVDEINTKMPFVRLVRSLSDTDSCHFSVPGLVEKYLESNINASKEDITKMVIKFEENYISPILNASTKENFDWMNDKEMLMSLDAEGVGDSEIITGKKRYAIRLQSVEGAILSHPKYKITGLEIKRSSTPALMRKKLDDALRLLFDATNAEAIDFMTTFESEYMSKKYSMTEIAIPTGISDMDKFEEDSTKSMPIHVRASVLHNKIVEQLGLNDISPICSGDKIKWVYLKQNKYGSNVVAFNDPKFLKIVGLENSVDLALMFEKTFLSPLEKLIESVGWKMNTAEMIMGDLF